MFLDWVWNKHQSDKLLAALLLAQLHLLFARPDEVKLATASECPRRLSWGLLARNDAIDDGL